MTDRELLELAAKAAGYEVARESDTGRGLLLTGVLHVWNPLESDGDAFRLVIRLKELDLWKDATQVEPKNIEGFWDGDPYAATRRAIVRAAAELGKSK